MNEIKLKPCPFCGWEFSSVEMDLISRQAAIDAVDTGNLHRGIVEALQNIISELPPAQQWIPVSERLPDNANIKGAFCPKYYVTTEFGQTEGWYNPDAGGWYVLLWFMDARFEKWNVSLDRGDVPKLVFGVPVIAWMPLPKPYAPTQSNDSKALDALEGVDDGT